jgi:tRNA(fMet)-specific endonuclease VapC
MIVLDTDHVSVLTDHRHSMRVRLLRKLEVTEDALAIPIVSAEEQLRGWLAKIHATRDVHRQIVPYLRLAKLIDFLADWRVAQWSEPAADFFTRLRSARIRIGTQDLKIAAIALANDALLLSANLRDFEKVPGLRVEDWLTA